MENKIASQLNVFYYGMMILTIVIVTLMLFGVSRGIIVPVDKMSSLGKTIQYIVIFDALITIPVGLWWFKRKCSLIAKMNDENFSQISKNVCPFLLFIRSYFIYLHLIS